MSRAKTPRPRPRTATSEDRTGRRALTQRQATIERAREERHVMLEAPRGTAGARPIEDDQVVEATELPEVRRLAVAVYDAAPHLAAAQQAVIAAGHVVVRVAAGRGGEAELRRLLAGGGLERRSREDQDDRETRSVDTLLVGLPIGEPLIDVALALQPHRPIVIAAASGAAIDVVRKAAAAGADLATTRPYDADRLSPVLFAASRLADERHHLVNARGSEAAMRSRLDSLAAPDPGTLQPFELFQRVLELELKRAKRYAYPVAVALFAVEIPPPPPPAGVRGILRARAGNALIHSIRDIDLATELDHERFLVLLPYTDLTGGSEVARRIIGAARACEPVVMFGRTFPSRLTGAVSGARPGQQISFAKLMRDASRALDQARHDGAELAVQPS